MLNDFITYLLSQVGQPYLWGGQHTKLTPENYIAVIERKEAGRGKSPHSLLLRILARTP